MTASTTNTKHKIFCLGLSRTGTTALAVALEHLGYRTLHYSPEAFLDYAKTQKLPFRPLSGYWARQRAREIKACAGCGLDSFLAHYQAFADLPFPLMYRELYRDFPSARFIYTFRELPDWLQSMAWLLDEGRVYWNHGLLDREICRQAYGTEDYNETLLAGAFQRHHREVTDFFTDKPNFLALNIDKGELDYGILTHFLGLGPCSGMVSETNRRMTVSGGKKWLYRARWSCWPLHLLAGLPGRLVAKFQGLTGRK